MTRLGMLVFAVAMAGAVAGCDDDNGTAPSNQPLVFSALLSPANEVPPVTNAESSGRGAMQVTITPTVGAGGAITAATANFHIQLYGFPAGTRMLGAHIHTGVAGVNGGVRVDTGFSATNTLTLTDGTANVNIVGIAVDPAVAQGIIDNPSAWYFNVHSPLNPGGFARGQLVRVR
jgi:hypothetical protein